MKTRLFLCVSVIFLSSQMLWAYTGREIMEKASNLPTPKTTSSRVIMKIHKGKQLMEKAFQMLSKEFENDEAKMLISFLRPTKIKLLIHSHKGRDDDLWMRLSSGKIKRIAAADMGRSFVNSHFYFEDMSSQGADDNIDEYDYKLLGDAAANGFDCYKVEAIKKKEDRVYNKGIFYVRKSDFFVIRTDLYKRNKFLKYLELYDVKTLDGILTPFRAVMYMADGKGKTELKIQSIEYNMDISNSKFNKEALR